MVEGKVGQMCHRSCSLTLLAYIRFLYKVVHKIGRLQKFNRSREIEFNFLTAWTIFMKFGTLVQHASGYKMCASDWLIFAEGLNYAVIFQEPF